MSVLRQGVVVGAGSQRRQRPRLAVAAAAAPPAAAAAPPADRDPRGGRGDCKPAWAGDPQKEERLRRFRVLFTFQDWAAHRSARRYWKHFKSIFTSRIVAGIYRPLFLVFVEATAVCTYEQLLKSGVLAEGWRSIQVRAPMLFSLSSFALSLLLVFRTNQSFARFDEARRLWSIMVNRCRDAARQAASYLGPQQPLLLGALSRWLQAFPWILLNHVREEQQWEGELAELLSPAELRAVRASPQPPLMALQVVTELLDRCPISAKQRLRIDSTVTDLSDVVGSCERLLRTPIPVSYTRHTCRFLVVWLALLPFSIYQQCGWVTVMSSVVLGFFLLSIEEIGVTIEEPFNILPLEELNQDALVDLNVRHFDAAIALVDAATGTQRSAIGHLALPME